MFLLNLECRLSAGGLPERCISAGWIPAAGVPAAAGLPTAGVSSAVRPPVRPSAAAAAAATLQWQYRSIGRMVSLYYFLLSNFFCKFFVDLIDRIRCTDYESADLKFCELTPCQRLRYCVTVNLM